MSRLCRFLILIINPKNAVDVNAHFQTSAKRKLYPCDPLRCDEHVDGWV